MPVTLGLTESVPHRVVLCGKKRGHGTKPFHGCAQEDAVMSCERKIQKLQKCVRVRACVREYTIVYLQTKTLLTTLTHMQQMLKQRMTKSTKANTP